MLKFYNIPLLTAGGFATEFAKPKTTTDNEYYMLTRTGYSYENIVKVIINGIDAIKLLFALFFKIYPPHFRRIKPLLLIVFLFAYLFLRYLFDSPILVINRGFLNQIAHSTKSNDISSSHNDSAAY